MIVLEVIYLLLRETARALLSPLFLLLYLPHRKHWRKMAETVLRDPAHSSYEQVLADFLRMRNVKPKAGRIFISAGETSGEAHAVKVITALRAVGGRATIEAFGGQPLAEAGAKVLFPLSDHAIMGLMEVFSHLPVLVHAVARFLCLLEDDPPDLVVLVDYPGLHLVMGQAARRRGIPVLHYIAPQYWAWGPWRMVRYKRCVDATLCILPFEMAFFRRAGIPSAYVGHPLLDSLPAVPAVPAVPAGHCDSASLCLLPGSRRTEIRMHLPGMIKIARRLREALPQTTVILPHVDERRSLLIQQILEAEKADFVSFVKGPITRHLTKARLVLAKSGTGSLEACLCGIPTVVVYNLRGPYSSFFYHNCLSVPYIASANLIAGRRIVPEFCFRGEQGWEAVFEAVLALFAEGESRSQLVKDLENLRHRLGEAGASRRVAEWMLPFCQKS